MKKTLIITLTDLDPMTAKDCDKLEDLYGAGNFAVLQGDGGLNTQIALMKLLREMTGAELIRTKDAADLIIKAIKDLGGLNKVRSDLLFKISKMGGDDIRNISSYISRNYGEKNGNKNTISVKETPVSPM